MAIVCIRLRLRKRKTFYYKEYIEQLQHEENSCQYDCYTLSQVHEPCTHCDLELLSSEFEPDNSTSSCREGRSVCGQLNKPTGCIKHTLDHKCRYVNKIQMNTCWGNSAMAIMLSIRSLSCRIETSLLQSFVVCPSAHLFSSNLPCIRSGHVLSCVYDV